MFGVSDVRYFHCGILACIGNILISVGGLQATPKYSGKQH